MLVRYDSEADAVFVILRSPSGGEAGGERLDETRIAHLDQAGRVFAYEFLAVSHGVSLEGIGADDIAPMSEALRPVKALAVA